MSLLGKIRSALTRRKRPSNINGAINAVLPIEEYGSDLVGLRAKRAARIGIRRTEIAKGRPKTRKLLRAEKDADWLRKVLQKRYDELCAKETS